MPAEHVMKAEGVRIAHSDGYTDICFSSDDGRLISAGDDGYACIWSDTASEDGQTMHQLGDSVSFLSVSKEFIHAVVANNTLSEFEFPNCTFKRICLKLSDQITHFAANSSYSTLAVGSSDFKIRLLDRETLSVPLSLNDHLAPVLSVAFSTGSDDLLASSSCDSTVRLWSAKDGKCLSTFGRVLPKSNDVGNSPTMCRLQFSNDSIRLYVPTEGEIKVYDVRNWQKPCEKIDLPKKTLVSSCIRFSKSGKHFAAICKDVLGIYSLQKSQWIARMNHAKPLCAIAWHPLYGNRLAFTDSRGQLGYITAPIDENGGTSNMASLNDVEMADEDDAALMAAVAQLGDDEVSNTSDRQLIMVMEDSPVIDVKSAPVTKKKDFDMSDDEEGVKVVKPLTSNPKPPVQSKSELKKALTKKFTASDDEESTSAPLALEEEVTNEDDDITDLGRIRKEFKEFFDDDEDDDEDEDSETSKRPPKDTKVDAAAKTSTPSSMKPGPLIAGETSVQAKPADSHLQRAFQVHSTPAGRGGSRFLVWNQLGVVRLYENESESSIEVEFHDASIHPPISLTSSDEIILAALTADVLVLASVASNSDGDDEESGSNKCRLRVLTLSAWDSSREWLIDLPSGEICVSVAIGSKWIAVVTNKQFVRFFSLGGFQLGILSLSGTPLTAVGNGDQFAVIYHNGVGPNQCQNLAFDLYKLADRAPKLASTGTFPNSPKSTLTWAGFGQDFGTLFSADSTSILRAYSLANRTWTPVANLRRCGQVKSRSDHYWMVGVSEKQQQIYAIFCKANTYPAVLPRPILSMVPLGVPVCDSGSDAGKLADEAIRLRLFNSQLDDADVKLQETLMRLFAIAIKQEKQCRAAEIAESMPSAHAIQLASKYAARLRLGHLADVLNEMAVNFEEQRAPPPPVDDDDLFGSMPYQSNRLSIPLSSHQVQETAQNLPVLATPPIVTLVKRPVGAQIGLTKDEFSSSITAKITTTTEPVKKTDEVEKVDDENESGDECTEEISVPVDKPSEPASDSVSKNPFSKSASKGNPFKNAAKPQIVASPNDAFSCFERVEPARPKAQPQPTSTSKEAGRKKKAADSTKEDGQASAKKKRTATKRKNEAGATSTAEEEGSENSKRSSSKNSDNAENEDSKDSGSKERPASGGDEVDKMAPKSSSKNKPGATAPKESTLRKLTDFMFAKNN